MDQGNPPLLDVPVSNATGDQTPRSRSPRSHSPTPSQLEASDILSQGYPNSLDRRWPGDTFLRPGTYSEFTTTTVLSEVPSLTFSEYSVSSSRYRASTSIASAVSGIPVADVNEPGSGPQHNGRQLCYECPFQFLKCTESFVDKEAWKTHALSHFRQSRPPTKADCPLCAPPQNGSAHFKDDIDDAGNPVPGSAWKERMEHVATHHELGWSLASARPDFDLYDFLWKRKIINEATYRSLKGTMRNSETMTSMARRPRR